MRFLLVFVLLASCSKNYQVKNYYPHLKWADQFNGLEVSVDKEFQQKKVSGMKITFPGKLKGHFLISEMMVDVDPDTATKLFKSKTQMIRGLYAVQATPYTGAITKEAGCDPEINIDPVVQDKKNQTVVQFDLKATERFVLGVCAEEQNVYRNQTLLIYCKNINTFYDLRYYYPKNEKPLKQQIAVCY